jgi:hypothetical protein
MRSPSSSSSRATGRPAAKESLCRSADFAARAVPQFDQEGPRAGLGPRGSFRPAARRRPGYEPPPVRGSVRAPWRVLPVLGCEIYPCPELYFAVRFAGDRPRFVVRPSLEW